MREVVRVASDGSSSIAGIVKKKRRTSVRIVFRPKLPNMGSIIDPQGEYIRFQSSFMLTTVQPGALSSSRVCRGGRCTNKSTINTARAVFMVIVLSRFTISSNHCTNSNSPRLPGRLKPRLERAIEAQEKFEPLPGRSCIRNLSFRSCVRGFSSFKKYRVSSAEFPHHSSLEHRIRLFVFRRPLVVQSAKTWPCRRSRTGAAAAASPTIAVSAAIRAPDAASSGRAP